MSPTIAAPRCCCRLLDSRYPQAICEAMKWILDNPQEAEGMGRRGRQTVESRLNWEHESQQLISVYEQIYGIVD